MNQPGRHKTSKPMDNTQVSMQAKAAARSFVKKSNKATGAFLTIREVADELGVQQHVLRFWETKFSQIKPMKRGGGRRYYRPDDVILLKNIQHLLYTEGYTIKGVQKLLRSEGKRALTEKLLFDTQPKEEVRHTAQMLDKLDGLDTAPSLNGTQQEALRAMLDELKALREFISSR